ncbi:MAG: undecaprenyl/decaprenyl-phosphate alpha-N-acetylglucosaminyl 1-phosphate transferase [Acidobacteriia bacterium]|nr:undecaprenyl/decaprenyl-phosphate alpha-N-acetylglucosaminyl 1-phosphate transferase [Terriglobia bacterium]
MNTSLIAFAVGLIASLSLTVPVRQLALRTGMVDHPGPRKVHVQPMPLLGGLAIYFGVLIALLVSMDGPALREVIGIYAGATLVAAVGILDDRGLLHHQIKLFGAMPAAAVILIVSGIRAQVFSAIWPGTFAIWADTALTLVWVVGITASFSILDHMDGLCAGVAAMASLFFAIFALESGQLLVSTMAAAVLGAAAGFLRWNFKPAKIFMGDGGAMFLGFLMATLALKLRPVMSGGHNAAWLIPIFILGATIFDTTLISISRSRRGFLPFTTPGKDHTAHRLSNIFASQRTAVLLMYALGAFFGLLALAISHLPARPAYTVAVLAGVAVLGAVALLERAPYERQTRKL